MSSEQNMHNQEFPAGPRDCWVRWFDFRTFTMSHHWLIKLFGTGVIVRFIGVMSTTRCVISRIIMYVFMSYLQTDKLSLLLDLTKIPGSSQTTFIKTFLVKWDCTFGLTFFVAQVRVKTLGLEHDEEWPPSQQHSREEQVLNDGSDRHPPASGEGGGQGRSHGRRRVEASKGVKRKKSGEQKWREAGRVARVFSDCRSEPRAKDHLSVKRSAAGRGVSDVEILLGGARKSLTLVRSKTKWGVNVKSFAHKSSSKMSKTSDWTTVCELLTALLQIITFFNYHDKEFASDCERQEQKYHQQTGPDWNEQMPLFLSPHFMMKKGAASSVNKSFKRRKIFVFYCEILKSKKKKKIYKCSHLSRLPAALSSFHLSTLLAGFCGKSTFIYIYSGPSHSAPYWRTSIFRPYLQDSRKTSNLWTLLAWDQPLKKKKKELLTTSQRKWED